MSETRPGQPGKASPGKPKSANSKPGKPGAWPGQPGTQPGDEWGEDNPGNAHGVGVDDHVFFHMDGAGPHAGRVVAHGVHGCQVDVGGKRHKVRWGRVLGVKQKAVLPAQVVERGQDGSILQHADGRRVFVAGELPLEDAQARLSSITDLEGAAARDKPRKLADLEEFARAGPGARARERDLSKADHECEGPALCPVCRAHAEDGVPLAKAIADGVHALSGLAERLGARPRSVGAGGRIPVLLRRVD